MTDRASYHCYRFPPEIISHAVWLYHRFCLDPLLPCVARRDVRLLTDERPKSRADTLSATASTVRCLLSLASLRKGFSMRRCKPSGPPARRLNRLRINIVKSRSGRNWRSL
jgi:hypothetical protein